MSEEINWDLVPKEPRAIWMTEAILAELKAEVAERQECIEKGFTAEQIDAHIKLWRADNAHKQIG